MRTKIGNTILVMGFISWFIFGLIGLYLSLGIVNKVAGFWGVVFGLCLFPITFVAAPWYALLEWGNWIPLLINYGGGIFTILLFYLAAGLSGDVLDTF